MGRIVQLSLKGIISLISIILKPSQHCNKDPKYKKVRQIETLESNPEAVSN